VKRRRSSAPGRLRSDGRWTHPILLAALLGVLLTACGQASSTEAPTDSAPSPSHASPGGTVTPDPSTEAPTQVPSDSQAPVTPDPTETDPNGPSANPSGGGSAAACSGSDENRDFFASMAAAVDWTVYCPVVPDGWFVDDGTYRLAGGGWMEISYNGPNAARLVLRQGSFCDTGEGCVPAGIDVGDTAFGDRTGTFVALEDGSWAIAVDRGATPSWLLLVEGLSESDARTIAADLQPVPG
jgi:hypothetical protein